MPAPAKWSELAKLKQVVRNGIILLADGQADEAVNWLTRALLGGIRERARFEIWRGKALAQIGDIQQEKEAYLNAFLEEPHKVDPELLQSPLLHNLFVSLECEDHELSEKELPAWLPVWAWIQGEWDLRLNDITSSTDFCSVLEEAERSGRLPLPRLWFEYLRYAEYLRTIARNGWECVRIRRLMRQRSGFMFDRYMEKIR